MENIKNLTLAGLEQWFAQRGEKPFRARQIFHWLYQKRADGFEDMTTLGKATRAQLAENFHIGRLEMASRMISRDGTIKYTFRIPQTLDGAPDTAGGPLIESVLMPSADHYTLCVSTQAGCAMGCTFCNTGTMGLARSLSTGEIVQQVIEAYRDIPEGDFVRNVVFMGMGEPFHNYDNVKAALDILGSDLAFGLSDRRMTVSTVGLVPGIRRFIADGLRANLAISLHAPDDATRSLLMPVNKRYPIAALMEALAEMPKESRIRITMEYILLSGVNDSREQARALAKLLHGIRAKVNLIPYNAAPDSGFKTPSADAVRAFQEELLDRGLVATVRVSRGNDIMAACGQLAVKDAAKGAAPKGITLDMAAGL